MKCPMIDTRPAAPGPSPCPSEQAPDRRREAGHPLLKRLLSRAGERLFHYRYVRAGLIERALEQAEHDRGEEV